MKISQTLTILLLLSLFASAAWGGSVYRWVDEDGNVQFSSSPPSGQAAEETRYRTGADRSRQAPAAAGQDQQPAREEQEDGDTEEAPAQGGPDMDALAEQHAQNCEQARRNLETIETNPRLQVEEDGERRYLTPEEIAEHRAEAEAVKEESCNWSPEQEGE